MIKCGIASEIQSKTAALPLNAEIEKILILAKSKLYVHYFWLLLKMDLLKFLMIMPRKKAQWELNE